MILRTRAQYEQEIIELWKIIDSNKAELARLRKIEAAAKNLIAVKGRYHSEQAYLALDAELKEG